MIIYFIVKCIILYSYLNILNTISYKLYMMPIVGNEWQRLAMSEAGE